jgi:hypothetical protein
MPPPPPPTPEWRTLALDPATDNALYRSCRNVRGRAAERGTDLLAHISPAGTVCYYLWHWTTLPGRTGVIQLSSEESARHFLREQGASPVTGEERLRELVPGIARQEK